MDKIVDEALKKGFVENLEKVHITLEETRGWQPSYLSKYQRKNPQQMLVKKAETTFSYFNPILNTR